MGRALARYAEIVPILPPQSAVRLVASGGARISRRLLGTSYLADFSIPAAFEQGLHLGRALARLQLDFVLAPFASAQAAMLPRGIPLVYSSDTTFRLMRGYYPSFSGLSALSYWEGETLERRAVRRAAALVYPSNWAAQSAVRDYGAKTASVLVAPYGANVDEAPDRARATNSDRGAHCTLCFVGVNWERKGGSVAVAVLHALRALGIPARLTVVGCEPPAGVDRSHMTVIPRIDKSDPAQRAHLAEVYFTSYFFVLPTRADCSPVVCCEASAHGTPILISDTGGVAGHVAHGINGMLMPPAAEPEPYVAAVAALWRNRQAYAALVASTRRQYEERLNWDAWARSVLAHVTRIVEARGK